MEFGVTGLVEAQIEQALHGRFANGDVEKATMFLLAYEDAVDGVIRDIDPGRKLVGAENRGGVTCYIDALLFAMFARLDTFDAMLYNHVDDEPRRTLSILLRVWVNMLRSGMLITEDIVSPPPYIVSSILLTALCHNRLGSSKKPSLTVAGPKLGG